MWRKIVLLVFLLIFIFALLGCVPDPPSSDDAISMVVLAGNHANSKNHDVPYEKYLREVFESFGNIGVVLVDGNPEIVYEEDKYLGYMDNDDIEYSKQVFVDNYDYWSREISNNIDFIATTIENLAAISSEVNTFDAFKEAIKLFNIMENSNKVIVVHDTGLCTDGTIDFRKKNFIELNDMELQDYIDKLIENDEIPDFSGICVKWYGIGDVASPQEELSALQKKKLRNIWYQIITSTGGVVEFFDIPSRGEFSVSQNVSVVDFSSNIVDEDVEKSFTKFDIFFEGDSDDYINNDVAEETLRQVTDEIKKSSDVQFMIIGCAAGNTDLKISELKEYISAERAKKIKDELIELGVEKSQIYAYSLGPYDPWHIPDSDGSNLIEQKAELNRRVTIIRSDSEDAIKYAKILEQGILK